MKGLLKFGLVMIVAVEVVPLGMLTPTVGQVIAQISSQDQEALTEAERLNNQVLELYQQGKYNEAIPLAKKALAIFKKILGDNHPNTATSLNNLAGLYESQGKYSEAETLYQQALAIIKAQLGDNHPVTAKSLNNLAALYESQGKYSEAEPIYKQALAIWQQQLGDNDLDTTASLNNLAGLYESQGKYSEAETLYQQALAIRKKQLGDNHPDTAKSLNNLAALYESQGKYSEAETLYQQALAIRKKQLGDNHPDTAKSLNNLAVLYESQGKYSEAETLYQQALTIRKKQLGDNHPDTAKSLNNLAALYESQGRYSEAEPLYKEALAINKKQLGNSHPDTATSLNNLASLYQSQGRYSEAEPLYKEALAIRKKQLGDNHPDTAQSLKNLSILYQEKGDFNQATYFYLRYLEILEKIQSLNYYPLTTAKKITRWTRPNNSDWETISSNNKNIEKKLNINTKEDSNESFYISQDNGLSIPLPFLIKTFEIQEDHIRKNMSYGDESQKNNFLKELDRATNIPISLSFESNSDNLTLRNFALTTIISYKGRILDVLTNSLQILRQQINDSESQKLLKQLEEVKTQESNLAFTPVNKFPSFETYRQQFNEVIRKSKELEDKVSRRSAEFRNLSQPITLEAIQKLIPTNAALVEIVRYEPFNPKATKDSEKFGKPHYAVYILFANGEIKAQDLGETQPIDDNVTAFRRNLADNKTPISQLKKSARQLDEKLTQPIRQLLGNTKTLLLSPDSALNLIPFEALVDENNQYLVENYQITYLTSGRDLLRQKEKFASQQPPLIIADPLYDQTGKKVALNPNSTRSINLADSVFVPLDGTKAEAEAIKKLLPKATVLTQAQATENALKQVKKPNILHIATHGFFSKLTDNKNSEENENPLLRSGLVFAGVKVSQSAGDDGVLSALEATNLNLVGTKLVVLSACDTGNGDIRTGEGVYGLRRALVIAGSESQLISLWKVSDSATKDLMIAYYQRLKNGEGRSEALRQTQLAMLKSEKQNHPFYWASFIPSGDSSPMKFD
jgi:CHAT domain-containing protein/Tfp pilus assembly protein PilF